MVRVLTTLFRSGHYSFASSLHLGEQVQRSGHSHCMRQVLIKDLGPDPPDRPPD